MTQPPNYPGNSKKAKEPTPQKKIEKVVVGEVTQRKKPLGKRFTETFFGGDAKGVFQYVALEVMLPAAKDMIADSASQGVERWLFGESRGGSRRRGGGGYVSYDKMSTRRNATVGRASGRDEERTISRRARTSHDFDEIVLETRAEGEEVLERLFDLISMYDQATVEDLYGMVGIIGSFTDAKWGWTDLRGARVRNVSGGYLLDLPRTEPLT